MTATPRLQARKKNKKTTEKESPILFQGEIQELILQALQEKMGNDIVLIDLRSKDSVFFDYFIICSGNAKPHVETLVDYVEEVVWKTLKIRPNHIEGRENSNWILIDYFNVIVHVFQKEVRAFYNIEKLWNDMPQQKINI